MLHGKWRKYLVLWRNRLYLYSPPDPLPHTKAYRVATGLVALLVLLFSAYFIFYLIGRYNAYITNAEDLGIMDQAIWNTLHGNPLHQTICNTVSDTNCYNFAGISRFAIHFEPILFPISLLYLIWPDPKALLALQTIVVSLGAFPAFWLARLRLRNELAAVAIALLYLLYPALQNALVFDFHPVTLTASLLLFTLYAMYTRRTAWLFIFALLSMACKEEIPMLIAFFGLWSMLFQRRWRTGLALVLLATAWASLALFVIHLSSPIGHSLVLSRYSYLGHNPLQIADTLFAHPITTLKRHIFEPAHRTYLAILLAPAGYLPLLAPWVLVLALPTLALNLLSSNPTMYSGLFQYNAELVPILIFSTIESIVLIIWLFQRGYLMCIKRMTRTRRGEQQDGATQGSYIGRFFLSRPGNPVPRRGGGGVEEGGDPWVALVPCLLALRISGSAKKPPRERTQASPPHDLTTPAPTGIGFGERSGTSLGRSTGGRATQASPPHVHTTPAPTGNGLAWLAQEDPTPEGALKAGMGSYNGLFKRGVLLLLLSYVLLSAHYLDYIHSSMPFAQDYRWPQITTHGINAQRFIAIIPPTASLSAQTRLVPHLSQRSNIYLFPYADNQADYIFLDLTSDKYPFSATSQAYNNEVAKVLRSGNYGILASGDGYLLLKRGLPPPLFSAIHYTAAQSPPLPLIDHAQTQRDSI